MEHTQNIPDTAPDANPDVECAPLSPFPIHNIQSSRHILVVGALNCGKTTLMRDILYHYHLRQLTPTGCLVSSIQADPTLKSCFPLSRTHDDLGSIDLCALHNQLKRQYHKVARTKQDQSKLKRVIICMDDLNRCDRKGGGFFTDVQSEHITFLRSVQYINDLSPVEICNLSYVFIFFTPLLLVRKKLYDLFFHTWYKEFNEFCTVMNSLGKHQCLVVDKMHERIYSYQVNVNMNKFQFEENEVLGVFDFESMKRLRHTSTDHPQDQKLTHDSFLPDETSSPIENSIQNTYHHPKLTRSTFLPENDNDDSNAQLTVSKHTWTLIDVTEREIGDIAC